MASFKPTPFLDLTAAISSGPERGLLGMALDPDYATNRRFYVFFTTGGQRSGRRGATEIGDLVVARFKRSVGDPLVADPASRFDLKWVSLGGQVVHRALAVREPQWRNA